jgi:hypothetical protein
MLEMKRIVSAALAAIFLFSAQASATCLPIPVFQEALKATGWTATELHNEQVFLAREIFNSAPPQTDAEVTTAALINRPDGGGFLVVGISGAYCASLNFEPESYKDLVKQIRGVVA